MNTVLLLLHTTKQRYRLSDLCPSVSVECVANCLNLRLRQWNVSEKTDYAASE